MHPLLENSNRLRGELMNDYTAVGSIMVLAFIVVGAIDTTLDYVEYREKKAYKCTVDRERVFNLRAELLTEGDTDCLGFLKRMKEVK